MNLSPQVQRLVCGELVSSGTETSKKPRNETQHRKIVHGRDVFMVATLQLHSRKMSQKEERLSIICQHLNMTLALVFSPEFTDQRAQSLMTTPLIGNSRYQKLVPCVPLSRERLHGTRLCTTFNKAFSSSLSSISIAQTVSLVQAVQVAVEKCWF